MPTIAVVDNVVQTENHSAVSIAWLDYIAEKNNIKIQHALEGGEKVINNKLKVDGFCESTNTVYEFQGCFWHGCPDCYKPDVINNKNQCDMGTLYNKTKAKNNKITSAGYNLIEMWECKLKKDKSFQKYYKNDLNREVVGPLNPRDGFFGGRTNASKLLYNFKDGEYGKYVDFCSLYPTVQFYKKYPIGHPEKIISPEKYDKKWYGFIKCKILAPRELCHPVLPQKIKCENSEKLMFPLCLSCAKSKQQERCQHNENERSFIGTWTTDEVNKAIEKGFNCCAKEKVEMAGTCPTDESRLSAKSCIENDTRRTVQKDLLERGLTIETARQQAEDPDGSPMWHQALCVLKKRQMPCGEAFQMPLQYPASFCSGSTLISAILL
ncbi:hypothetical protein ACROYT_G039820 [Oculina patagonica]